MLATRMRMAAAGLDENIVLAAPTGLAAAADGGYNRIALAWTSASSGEDGHKIERSPDGSTGWTQIGTVAAGAATYTDYGLTPGATYYYRVRAYQDSDNSDYSSTANDTVWDPSQVSAATLVMQLESTAGLYQDAAGTTPISADGDPVGLWEDQEGSQDFDQSTAGYKPLYKERIFNNLPGVYFDGSDDALNSVAAASTWTFMHNGTSHHIFAVFKSDGLNPGTMGAGFGNYAGSSANRGFAIWYDDRHASSAYDRFTYVVTRGVTSSFVVNLSSGDGYAPSNMIHLFEAVKSASQDYKAVNGQVKLVDTASGAPSTSDPNYNVQIGATGNGVLPGAGYYGAIFVYSGELTEAEITKVRQYLERYKEATAFEQFVDASRLEAVNGLTLSVNTGTKYASNPVFSGGTWDEDKMWTTVIRIGATYYMWYATMDDSGHQYTCYATSSDGLTWTRPSLGLYTYGGVSTNNIIRPDGYYATGLLYDSGGGSNAYLLLIEGENEILSAGAYIHNSSDGINFAALKTVFVGGSREGKALIKLPDGRYAIFYTTGHTADDRYICAFVSATTDPAGSWYDYGRVIPAGGATNQKYALAIHEENGTYFALVMIYNSTTEQIDSLDLYLSHNGLDYELASTDWLNVGASGAWDDEMLINGGLTLTDDGANTWRVYYAGSAANHAASVPRDARIGYATAGKGRLGQVAGTGEVITAPLYAASGTSLYINADASGGKVEVEVLDEDYNVITNYAQADFTGITSDTYSTAAAWGASSLPTEEVIRLRFILTNATLYSYAIE